MANEEMQMETILKRKEDPKNAIQTQKPKAAKLNERTHKSLMSKIKEDIKESYGEWKEERGQSNEQRKEEKKQSKLTRAFDRYNKRYAKVVKAVQVVNEAKEEKENYELASEHADVVKYDRRLAKYGVKLLKQDINGLAQEVDLTAKQIKCIEKARRLKVPKFLVDKMFELGHKINASKQKKAMKQATKEYIKDSLRGAVYTKEGLLQEEIDKKVINDLGTKTEEGYSLENLRKFISKDGKTPLFTENSEEELGKKTKVGMNLPLSAPKAEIEKDPEVKEEQATIIKGLLSGLQVKKEPSTEINKKEEVANTPVLSEQSGDQAKIENIKVKPVYNKENEVIEAVMLYMERMEKATTEEEKSKLTREHRKELDKIVSNKQKHVSKQKSEKAEVKQEADNLEPIEVSPKQEKPKAEEIKQTSSTPTRAKQVSLASKTTFSFEDVKRLRAQMEEDKAQIAINNQGIENVTKRIEELKEQKATLVEQMKKQAESLRLEKEASEAKFSTLQGTAEKLESEVSYLTSEQGPTKK